MPDENKEKCFVIMPISDPDGYEPGHFRKIYEQIFAPAIISAGFQPHRADDDKSSNLILANILEDLIKAPMAICDLSTRNPNVLYELGIRHAYDKPVVLVQQSGTERIFDITGINAINYRKNRYYDEVLEDRSKIAQAITATFSSSYSLAKMIKISKANYSDQGVTEDEGLNMVLNSIMNEIKDIKQQVNPYEIVSAAAQMEKKRKSYLDIDRNKNIYFKIDNNELDYDYLLTLRDFENTVFSVENVCDKDTLKQAKELIDYLRNENLINGDNSTISKTMALRKMSELRKLLTQASS